MNLAACRGTDGVRFWAMCMGGDGDRAANGQAYHHVTVVEFMDPDGCHVISGNDDDMVRRSVRDPKMLTFVRPFVLA